MGFYDCVATFGDDEFTNACRNTDELLAYGFELADSFIEKLNSFEAAIDSFRIPFPPLDDYNVHEFLAKVSPDILGPPSLYKENGRYIVPTRTANLNVVIEETKENSVSDLADTNMSASILDEINDPNATIIPFEFNSDEHASVMPSTSKSVRLPPKDIRQTKPSTTQKFATSTIRKKAVAFDTNRTLDMSIDWNEDTDEDTLPIVLPDDTLFNSTPTKPDAVFQYRSTK